MAVDIEGYLEKKQPKVGWLVGSSLSVIIIIISASCMFVFVVVVCVRACVCACVRDSASGAAKSTIASFRPTFSTHPI
jgi:hypothetical protein